MRKGSWALIALLLSFLLLWVATSWKRAVTVEAHSSQTQAKQGDQPIYTAEGRLVLPANYREWVFLSAGFGMNYSNGSEHSPMFTNVYVSPEAYRGFKSEGKWPQKSMFVVEVYSPTSQGSINKSGYYQDQFMGLDVEVKDSTRKQEWSYFNFDPQETTAAALGGSCEKCHNEHAAVEHTFVQFYPTLLNFARTKKLLKPGVQVN
jgi:Cytochrome P460